MKCGTGNKTPSRPLVERFPYYPGLTLHEVHNIQRGLEAKREDHRSCAERHRAEGRNDHAAHHDRLADEYDELLTTKFSV